MKKFYLSLSVGLLLSFFSFGQSLTPSVIASAGDFFANEDGSLSWTLGETVIEIVSNESGVLTQGFQQSWFFITPVEELDTPGIDISIYPNPVNDIVTLEFLSDEELPEFHLELFDLLGNKGDGENYQTDLL